MLNKVKDYATLVKNLTVEATESIIKYHEEKNAPATVSYSAVIRDPKGPESITPEKAVKIVYFLMAADGLVYSSEEEKYVDIARELYSVFDSKRSEIDEYCKLRISEANASNDYFSALVNALKQLLNEPIETGDGFIPSSLFLWNLFAIAYSDNSYSPEEEKIIKYVAAYMDVEKSVFLEFENAIKTIGKLDEEKSIITAFGEKQLSCDSFVKYMDEIENRKRTILENVKGLIISKGE